MKQIILVFGILLIASCSEDLRPCYEASDCTGDCIFYENDIIAEVGFYSCYDSWGFTYSDSIGENIIALYPEMPDSYKTEGMQITVSALFFENDLPLTLPDPMPGTFYRVEGCGLSRPDR